METGTTIDLTGRLKSPGPVSLLRAEAAGETSSFATIYYSISGQEQPLGLRLDINKRAFLDLTGDAGFDAKLQSHADEVVDLVIEGRETVFGRSPKDLTLDDAVSLDGLFWLPDRESEKQHGTMHFNIEDGIHLRLHKGLGSFQTMMQSEIPIVHARLDDGSICSFFDCLPTKQTWTNEGPGPSSIYANRAIFGVLHRRPESLEFRKCSLQLSGLENWLGINTINVEHSSPEDDRTKVQAMFETPDPIRISPADSPVATYLKIAPSWFQSVREFRLETHAMLISNSKEALNLDQWIVRCAELQALFTFLAGSVLPFHDIVLHHSDSGQGVPQTCKLIFVPRLTAPSRGNNQGYSMLAWSQVRSLAPTIFERWLSMPEKITTSLAQFLYVAHKSDLPLEFRFLNVITAIEIFSRELANSEWNGIARNAPSDSDIRNLTEAALREIIKDLPAPLLSRISGDDQDFVKMVVAIRNRISHGVDSSAEGKNADVNLFLLMERLSAIFVAKTLMILGVAPDNIVPILKRHPKFGHILGGNI